MSVSIFAAGWEIWAALFIQTCLITACHLTVICYGSLGFKVTGYNCQETKGSAVVS